MFWLPLSLTSAFAPEGCKADSRVSRGTAAQGAALLFITEAATVASDHVASLGRAARQRRDQRAFEGLSEEGIHQLRKLKSLPTQAGPL